MESAWNRASRSVGVTGHWGLPGMRERAKNIGARFELWSEAELEPRSKSSFARPLLTERPRPPVKREKRHERQSRAF